MYRLYRSTGTVSLQGCGLPGGFVARKLLCREELGRGRPRRVTNEDDEDERTMRALEAEAYKCDEDSHDKIVEIVEGNELIEIPRP